MKLINLKTKIPPKLKLLKNMSCFREFQSFYIVYIIVFLIQLIIVNQNY